jgi:hypothetical protein
MDWKEFLDSRNIMVTETNCNWDQKEDLFSTPEVQCEKITGQFRKKTTKRLMLASFMRRALSHT